MDSESDSTSIEVASNAEAAVVPFQALVNLKDNTPPPSLSTSSEDTTAEQLPLPGIFHKEGNDLKLFIAPRHFHWQEPLEVTAAAAATSPVTENMQARITSIPSLNEQPRNPNEPEEDATFGQAELCHLIPGSMISQHTNAAKLGSFASILSEQPEAAHTIIVIPNVNADAILDQAVTFKMEFAINNFKAEDDPKAVPIQIILQGPEGKTLQAFISTGMITAREAVHLRGGLSTLRSALVAALLGAIGAWIAMAFA